MRQTLTGMLVCLSVSGCVADSDLIRGDHSAWVQNLARERAIHDLNCKFAIANRPIRADRMKDWQEHLFSEYSVWVEGCGKTIAYQLICQDDNICAFNPP